MHEPFEALTVDIEEANQGAVMEALGSRRAELTDMSIGGQGRARLEYRVPARGLIGFQGEFLTLTRGTGLISHIFDGFGAVKGEIPDRHNGVLVSNENGEAVAYALFNLQERGRMFVSPGEKLYEGMIIGIHSRENDLVVNPIKTKKLTNVRAAGKDDAILLMPPIQLTLEYAVEFIAEDELVEVTPLSIRIRKRYAQGTGPQARLAQRLRRGRLAPGGRASDFLRPCDPDKAQELPARAGVAAEHPEHAAGDHRDVALVHPAGGHALVHGRPPPRRRRGA